MWLGAGVYRSVILSNDLNRSTAEPVQTWLTSHRRVWLCVLEIDLWSVRAVPCLSPYTVGVDNHQKNLGCVFYVNRVICNRVKSEVLSRFWNDMLMHQLFYHSSKLRTFWSINISCIVVAKCFGGGTNVVFLDICIVFCFHISWIKWRTTAGILSLWDTSIGK